jgi:hypothetical protein
MEQHLDTLLLCASLLIAVLLLRPAPTPVVVAQPPPDYARLPPYITCRYCTRPRFSGTHGEYEACFFHLTGTQLDAEGIDRSAPARQGRD